MATFNLNAYWLVQINEIGWRHLRSTLSEPEEYIKNCILPYATDLNEETWYKLQAHQVISLFGAKIGPPNLSPIGMDILIP